MSNDTANRIRVDRRTTIKWLAATMAGSFAGCQPPDGYQGDEIPPAPADLLLGVAGEPGATGYGTDPDLVNSVVPWPRTMTDAQLRAAGSLCDTILPADERSPAPSELGVPDFIDEWISAPYAQQRDDRVLILNGLEWLEKQSYEQSGAGFAGADDSGRSQLLDRIADPGSASPELADRAQFFGRFRFLTAGAFYTTEPGMRDIGYIGNVAISGNYPGPSDEAMAHLSKVLAALGLSLNDA